MATGGDATAAVSRLGVELTVLLTVDDAETLGCGVDRIVVFSTNWPSVWQR